MTGRIEIDPAALERAARDLADAGARLSDVAAEASATPIPAQAFGSMNSYLGTPIALAARHTAELLRAAGDVADALSVAARAAAADFVEFESDASHTFTEMTADLSGAREIL